MGGIGAFIQGFANTTMEMQKRAQEERQFKMQLEMQKTQLEMQREQFNQQLEFREAQRQDELKQNKFQNQMDIFREKREAANTQNMMEERTLGREQKTAQAKAETARKYAEARNNPKIIELKKRQAALRETGFDTSEVDAALAQQQKELLGDLPPEEEGAPVAQQGQPLTGQSAPQQAPQEATQGQQMAQPMQPGQMQASGAPGPSMAPPGAQPPAAAPGQPQQVPSRFQLREFEARSPQEEAAFNAFAKQNEIPAYATSPETKIKTAREKEENLLKAYKAQAAMAETQKGQISDLFRQAGIQVDIDVHQEGTKTKSRRAGGHFGGMILGSGLSFGGTTGSAEKTLPSVDLFPKSGDPINIEFLSRIVGEPGGIEDKSVGTTARMGEVLYDAAINKGMPVSQVWVGAVQDVMRDRIKDSLGKFGKEKSFEVGSFDAILDPKRHQAASNAVVLAREDEQMRQVSEKNNLPYYGTGVPQVSDKKETTGNTLNNFWGASKKISRTFPNLQGFSQAEGQMASELATRMQGKTLDPEERKDAQRILSSVQNDPGVSDQYKKSVQDILNPMIQAAPVDSTKARTGFIPTGKGSGRTSALEGLSRMGAPVASAENVKAANKAFNSVTQKTKDNAPEAVKSVNSEYSQMTDKEKNGAQSTWKAKRATWKNYGVQESVLRDMNAAVGLARNDGLTA